jgi:demethylmenaquinone methyltransferase/2-methoxy-6-polyprenyl-1,4-benzoquinol methylase
MRSLLLKVSAAFAVVAAFIAALLLSVDVGTKVPRKAQLGSGAMFDSIAETYDVTNKVISLGSDVAWRKELVASLDLQASDRVLDLATGTADVAIMLAKDKSRPTVTGVDPSPKMLDHGRRKLKKEKLDDSVKLYLGDAQQLTNFATNSFDKAAMSFGIRNVPDRVAALREYVHAGPVDASVFF